MRPVAWILVILLAVSWIAVELPVVIPAGESAVADTWRRTVDGWERARWLRPQPSPAPIWLHPAGLVSFQIMVSVGGLLAAPKP